MIHRRFGKRVVVVDTSNEIAGGGDVPHPFIGRARRIPVRDRKYQHNILIEAVQNHNPEARDLFLLAVLQISSDLDELSHMHMLFDI